MNQTGGTLGGIIQTSGSLERMNETSGSILFNDGLCDPSDESILQMTTSEDVEVGVVGGGAAEEGALGGVIGEGEQSAVQETIKQL